MSLSKISAGIKHSTQGSRKSHAFPLILTEYDNNTEEMLSATLRLLHAFVFPRTAATAISHTYTVSLPGEIVTFSTNALRRLFSFLNTVLSFGNTYYVERKCAFVKCICMQLGAVRFTTSRKQQRKGRGRGQIRMKLIISDDSVSRKNRVVTLRYPVILFLHFSLPLAIVVFRTLTLALGMKSANIARVNKFFSIKIAKPTVQIMLKRCKKTALVKQQYAQRIVADHF